MRREKEGIGKTLLHLPGDYVRGMSVVSDDHWVVSSVFSHTVLGFVAAGVLGVVATLGTGFIPGVHLTSDSLGIGWFAGAGVGEIGITSGATLLGRSIRRNGA